MYSNNALGSCPASEARNLSAYKWKKRLVKRWFAIGTNAAWDWGETFLFGTPNSGLRGQHALMNPLFHGPTLSSGGTDGPEGSVLVLLSEALIVVLVAIIYRQPRFPLITDRAVK